MTESGFPPLPPRGQTPPPAPSGAGSEEGLRVQLIGMPSSIRTIERPVRIEGEIGRPNSDGSVRVRTAQGDIDIRPEPGRSPPREGTRVELELKPGTPPNRGTLYVAGTAVPSDANQPAPDVRSRETPVKVTVDGSSKTETPRPVPDAYSSSVRVDSAAPVPPPLFPASGALVRLDPLTLEQAQ
ncbi:MAG: hypothetical protein K9G62_06020, partial [Alphaproteobacteria bacterium]|nr:hypothetical protein [Alphaproteobacteria bacterium]